MATLTEIGTKVLKRATVLDPRENPTANDSADVLEIINQMLAEWIEQDCDLSLTLPLSGSDTITDQLQISAIVSNAAMRVCNDFGVPVSQQLYDQAYSSKSTLQNSLETLANITLDQALLDAGKRRDPEII